MEGLGRDHAARFLKAASVYALLGDAEAGRRLTAASSERFQAGAWEKGDGLARIAALHPGAADPAEMVRAAEAGVLPTAGLGRCTR
jgi:hypothetical protein